MTYTKHSFLHGILQIQDLITLNYYTLLTKLMLNSFPIRRYFIAKCRTETSFWE